MSVPGHIPQRFSRGRLAGGLLILAVINLLWFWPIYTGQGLPAGKDLVLSYQPMHYSLAVEDGPIRLWEPRGGFGFPMLAESQASQLYPPSLLARWLLPPETGIFPLICFHFFLAGVFMLILARELGLGLLSGLAAGLAWMGAGFLVSHASIPPILYQAVWLPALLACVVRFGNTHSPAPLALAGLLLGCQALAGHFQMLVFGGLFLGAFSLLAFPGRLGPKALVRWLPALVLIAGLGVAWSWVQLKPTFDFFLASSRDSGASGDWLSWNPLQAATLIQPHLFGADHHPVLVGAMPEHLQTYWGAGVGWVTSFYLGVTGLILALASLRGARTRLARFLWLALAVSLTLAAGKYLPLKAWLDHLPLIGAFQYPARWLYLALFCLALLAGLGMEHLLDSDSAIRQRLAKFTMLGGVVFLVLLTVAWWAAAHHPALLAGWLGDVDKYAPRLALAARTLDPLAGPNLWALFLLAATGLILWPGGRPKWSAGLAAGLLLALMATDSGVFLARQQVLIEPEFYQQRPGQAARAAGLTPGDRYFSLARYHSDPQDHQLDLLPPSLNLRTGLATVDYRGSLYFARFKRYFAALDRAYAAPDGRILDSPGGRRLFNLAGVGYFLRRQPCQAAFTELTAQKGPTWVYEVRGSLARVRWAGEAVYAKDDAQAWDLIQDPGVDLQRRVVLETAPRPGPAGNPTGPGQVSLEHESPGKMVLRTKTDTPGWLVLSQTYSPKWQARVDGRPSDLLRADYLFSAVALPPGEHKVKLRYLEPALFWGLASAGLALGISLLMLFWPRAMGRKGTRQ